MDKFLKCDDEIRVLETHEEFLKYLEFRREHDEWIEVFINELAAVGIPNEPLFIPKYCTDISVKKNGFTQELPDIDFEDAENAECIKSPGIFLAFPYKNRMTVMPTRQIAYPSIIKRAADDCGTMMRFDPLPSKSVLPVNEKAERLTRDFLLYSDTCKILLRDGKISAVLSKAYVILPAIELVESLEEQLKKDHPGFSFDRGQVSHEYLVAEYLLNDREMEESFRLSLNEAGAKVKALKAGVRFSTSDVGLGKVYTTLFYDADGVRTALSGRIEIEHDGKASVEQFRKMLENLGMLFKESEEKIEELGNTELNDVAGTVRNIIGRYTNLPKSIGEEVAGELSSIGMGPGTAIDAYLALNDIVQRQAKKQNISPTRYLNQCELAARLMHLPFKRIDAGEDWS